MALVSIPPTRMDLVVANSIVAHADPAPEKLLQAITYGADERLLVSLAVAGWAIAMAGRSRHRSLATHALAVSVTVALLPHLMKDLIDQTRPDRLTIKGRWRGIPRSGSRRDAFPSGHAVHMGALASGATLLPEKPNYAIWALATALSVSRVGLLAHWLSDVVVGFAMGALIERGMRRVTGVRATDPPK